MSLSSIFRNDKHRFKLEDGFKVEIKPLTVKQTLIVEGLLISAASDFALKGDAGIEFQVDHADAFIAVVAACINKPVAYVEQIKFSDFNRILATLLEINRDFFNALAERAKAGANKKRPIGRGSSSF